VKQIIGEGCELCRT